MRTSGLLPQEPGLAKHSYDSHITPSGPPTLTRIPACPINTLDRLLPNRWKAARLPLQA